MKKFQFAIKRLFDIVVSAVMLVILSPILIILMLAVRFSSKGSVFYKQTRIGKNNKEFSIFKFRSMLLEEERVQPDGSILDPRDSITKVGKLLRKTSLDELPQLLNVLIGDMSLCGPRPIIPYRFNLMNEEQKKRHDVRPGVTGLAQVNGRNELTWDEKFKYDLEYVDKFSLWLDIKIFFKTVAAVFSKKGISYLEDKYHKPKNADTSNEKTKV